MKSIDSLTSRTAPNHSQPDFKKENGCSQSLPPPAPVVLSPLPVSGSQPVTGRSESGLERWSTAGPTLRRMEAEDQDEEFLLTLNTFHTVYFC